MADTRLKVCTIVGARPQFIKAAVVSRAFKKHPREVHEVFIHTGQHFDVNMSDVFFDELDIPRPDHHLGIGGGTHGQNTGRMIEAIEAVLLRERPAWVLVYGDTDSTLAAAVAGVKLRIPVAHVEAGLRSFNRKMPEEINRVLTDHTSDLLFTPTDNATRNLANEGIAGDQVQQVGDVMYDAALYYGEKSERQSQILSNLGLQSKGYVLATVHRAENSDHRDRMTNILAAFAESPLPIIWPLHPRTRRRLADFGLEIPKSIRAIEPVGYLDMMMLEKHATLIATDSGGVQKEAYFHRVPCVTLRDETEWVELVKAGVNHIVGSSQFKIRDFLGSALSTISPTDQIYGDGEAGARVCQLFIR